MKTLVVVAPTYNEEANIELFIKAVLSQKSKLNGFNLQLVISDGHSTDRTSQIVANLSKKEKSVHFLDVQKRGLGLGMEKGLDFAVNKLKADYLITLEADMSVSPDLFPIFVQKLETSDLVVGSRYVKGGRVENWTWWRKCLSRAANIFLQFASNSSDIHEFTNIYRAFRSEVWIKIRNQTRIYSGWIFAPAFLLESSRFNFKISEVPITLRDRVGGTSKMRTVSYTKNLLLYAIRFKLNKN